MDEPEEAKLELFAHVVGWNDAGKVGRAEMVSGVEGDDFCELQTGGKRLAFRSRREERRDRSEPCRIRVRCSSLLSVGSGEG